MSTHSRIAALPRPDAPRAAALTVATVLGLALMVLTALPAAAHNALVSSDPADGSTLATAPAHLTLVFNEPAQELGSRVVVTDPNGAAVSTDAVQVADTSVIQQLTGDLPAGTYTVTWRVTSADGHPIDGTLTFTTETATTVGTDLAPAATTQTEQPAPEPTATESVTAAPTGAEVIAEDEDAGLAAGAIIAIAVAVLAVIAVVGFVIHERRKTAKTAQDK